MPLTDYQLTELLDHCLNFAKQMIERHGEFHAFGADVGPLGALQAIGFWDGRENPPGAELYALALNVMAQKAASGEMLGGAIAANVNIPPQFEADFPDGIRVQLEADDYHRLFYLPYRISRSGWISRKTAVEYGTLFAVDIAPGFFGSKAT